MDVKLKLYVDRCTENYKEFMGLDSLPSYQLVQTKISLEEAIQKGFGCFASHFYNTATWKHTLNIWSEIWQPQFNAEYMIFHELTHLLDTEKYVNKDKTRNAAIRGYTEYHAAQVDFLRLLGNKKLTNIHKFSMNEKFMTVEGEKSAKEYVEKIHDFAVKLIKRKGFPADMETLSIAINLIFNYWGTRSICRLYSSDYSEDVDDSVIETFLGKEIFGALNVFMEGWLNSENIEILGEFYIKMIVLMAKKYSLQ